MNSCMRLLLLALLSSSIAVRGMEEAPSLHDEMLATQCLALEMAVALLNQKNGNVPSVLAEGSILFSKIADICLPSLNVPQLLRDTRANLPTTHQRPQVLSSLDAYDMVEGAYSSFAGLYRQKILGIYKRCDQN